MIPISRRQFAVSVVAGAGAGILGTAAALADQTPRLHPCAPSEWTKHGIVLADDQGPIQNFTCPAEPLGEGRWRIWYSLCGRDTLGVVGFAEGVPGQGMKRQPAMLSSGAPADAPLAIGNLPDGWRPTQPVHMRLADGRHRLYFWAHGPKVARYLAADSDDGRRYRVVDPLRPCLYHPHDRAVAGNVAVQCGLKRLAGKIAAPEHGEPLASPELISNDATNVYRLADGTFEMYSVALVEVTPDDPRYVAHDNAAGWIRVIDRYVSRDGLHWTGRQRVLQPDAQDPIDMQFYYLAITHTPQGRIGMLGHYRVGAQTMDLEWCFSQDGLAWHRPARKAWIERGKPGEPDSYGIYAPHALVRDNDRWHLFYTATNTAHNERHAHGRPTTVVMHATCPNPWKG